MDERMIDRLFHSTDDTALAETADKPLTRAQKKNVRKKQKKKEKKSVEIAFEIEELTTGVEDLSFSEELPGKTCQGGGAGHASDTKKKGGKVCYSTVHTFYGHKYCAYAKS